MDCVLKEAKSTAIEQYILYWQYVAADYVVS